ncbi:MAG: hypothetical protein ABIH34_08185 [Nanoarchaeota archaeon]
MKKRVGMKRGQLTVFIILGLVMIGAFAIVIYLSNLIGQEELDVESNAVINALRSTTPFEAHVNNCLEQVSLEALRFVGKQGGVIYNHQVEGTRFAPNLVVDKVESYHGPGFIPLKEEDRSISLVGYGLYAPKYPDPVRGLYPFPPEYPYRGPKEPYYAFKGTLVEDNGYSLGDAEWLLHLCQDDGANAKDIEGKLGISAELIRNSCKDIYSPSERTIQSYLEKYVEEELPKCVGLVDFGQSHGFQIDPAPDSVEATFFFGDDDVYAVVFWPLTISMFGEDPVTDIFGFSVEHDIRFKKIYFSAMRLLEKEKKDPFFDAELHQHEQRCEEQSWYGDGLSDTPTPCVYEGMEVVKLKNVCGYMNPDDCNLAMNEHYKFSDILRITDHESMIGDEPYVFQFAVENRYPALDFITNTPPGNDYDIITVEGATVLLYPNASDPDFDLHGVTDPLFPHVMKPGLAEYLYSGWREEYYNEFLDDACCSQPEKSCDSVEGVMECVTENLDIPEGEEKWTESDLFLNGLPLEGLPAKHQALIKIKREDVGKHTTQIKVCDDEELCDWQDISILVFDRPVAEISDIQQFPDIPEDVISIEDPVEFDASKSIAYLSTIGEEELGGYRWHTQSGETLLIVPFPAQNEVIYDPNDEDDTIDFGKYYGNLPSITYPYQNGGTPYTIHNILTAPVTFRIPTGVTYLNLSVTSVVPSFPIPLFNSVLKKINVVECVPTGKGAGAYDFGSTDPYPYFAGEDIGGTPDPYRTVHACCEGTVPINYKLSDRFDPPCYELHYYTHLAVDNIGWFLSTPVPPYNKALKDNNLGELSSVTPYNIDKPNVIPDTNRNDIWQRDFTQKCSGNRGNACSGEHQDSWSVAFPCPPIDSVKDEACVAPCIPGFNCNEDGSLKPGEDKIGEVGGEVPACMDVPASRTFESLFLEGSNTCDTDFRCSDKNDPHGYNKGPGNGAVWECQATCDGAGGCTKPVNCGTCDVDCNAECDADNPCPGYYEDSCYGDRWKDYNGNEQWDGDTARCVQSLCECTEPSVANYWEIDENITGSAEACRNQCSSGIHGFTQKLYWPESENVQEGSYHPNCCGDDTREYLTPYGNINICCDRETDCGIYWGGEAFCIKSKEMKPNGEMCP